MYIYIYMFEASAHEVHTTAYFSRLLYSCPTQPVASDTMADRRERTLQARVAPCKDSYRESSPRRRSRLAQQRVRQSLLHASETESQRTGRSAAPATKDYCRVCRRRPQAQIGCSQDPPVTAGCCRFCGPHACCCATCTQTCHTSFCHTTQLAYARPTMLCIHLV